MGGVNPGLRRGWEAPLESSDSAKLIRYVMPVVVVVVDVVGVADADLLGAEFESFVKRVSEGLFWSAVWPGVNR